MVFCVCFFSSYASICPFSKLRANHHRIIVAKQVPNPDCFLDKLVIPITETGFKELISYNKNPKLEMGQFNCL